jgi:hypothetical protein
MKSNDVGGALRRCGKKAEIIEILRASHMKFFI